MRHLKETLGLEQAWCLLLCLKAVQVGGLVAHGLGVQRGLLLEARIVAVKRFEEGTWLLSH